MEITKVIKSPILSEKTDILRTQNNVYVFKVDFAANKFQIKEAIETIFNVKVAKVNTIKVHKKPKNVGRYHGFTNRYKKAMVTLEDGQVMNYLPNDATTTTIDTKEVEEAKAAKAQKSMDVEAKVAQKLAAKKSVATKTVTVTKKTTTKRKVGGE
ncbi:large subunit ribosomal protein L23 [Mycoplasmopsis mustelae]|uniref:Large ribosomal subunit protein uL23 n=1 Tax=Mycoplasmopsis mustelae TaxID=171289 RepID=A0A4R7UCT5_9BACT|nr:50S ribosomal protein L23 [Mycoplasmopsis mustelae]TDV24247.1 large subunit ribosomal protein L23 [Mycoplasmopsis mustelae]